MWMVLYTGLFCVLSGVEGANILILHPVYSGSHTIVLRQFGDYLVSRGHHVTQVKFRQSNSNSDPHSKVDVLNLAVKDPSRQCWNFINADGEFDLGITAGSFLWNQGSSLLMFPTNVFCLVRTHCNTLFSSAAFAEKVNSTVFDVALVDLFLNDCGLAYARSMGIPVAGFWGWSLQSSEVGHLPVLNLPSFVPNTLSGLSLIHI